MKKITIEEYQLAIDDIANQLCKSVDGNFNFIVTTDVNDETAQKLGMLINFVLDAAWRSIKKTQQHQQELAHFSRLNTAGELASGIAHELNQPLSAIVQYTGGCLERLKKESTPKEIIEVMEKVIIQAERAGAIIHKLKDFLRKGNLNKTLINTNETIQESLTLIDIELTKNNVDVICDFEKNLPQIYADSIQIQQVILNIVNNAIDAMDDKDLKQLTLQTSLVEDRLINITISDTGTGIAEENIEQVFSPFFTTKKEGMGMGLSISKSIIEAHQGKMSVRSILGEGTQFCIALPFSQ